MTKLLLFKRLFFNIVIFNIIMLFISSFFQYANADTVIIAAKNSNFTTTNAKTIKKLWLGKKQRLNGKKVFVIDQQIDTPAQVEFYQKLLKKNNIEMKAYWAKLVFMGKSFPPRKLANDEKVKAWLIKHPNSIGYIDANAIDDTVIILLTIKSS